MNKTNIKPILFTMFTSVLLFSFYIVISKICFAIFIASMFETNYIPQQIIDIVKFIISLFVLYSVSYIFNTNNKYALSDYENRGSCENYLGSKIRHVFSGKFFWIQLSCIAILSLVLPASFTYGFVHGAFLHSLDLNSPSVKLFTLAIIIPVMFLLLLLANIESCRRWFCLKHKKKSIGTGIPKAMKELFQSAVIYFAGSMCIPWFLPFIITIINLGNRYNLISFLLYVIAVVWIVVFVYFSFVYLRAVSKRKAFMNELRRLCKKDNIVLSGVQNVYSTVFIKKHGINFCVEKDKRRYDCKFVPGIFYNSPIIFSEQGNGICKHTFRLLKFEIFSILSRVDFDFESENEKILIVLPIPKDIYVATSDSQPSPADTGDKVGEYKIYNATGFLNGLERNCIV